MESLIQLYNSSPLICWILTTFLLWLIVLSTILIVRKKKTKKFLKNYEEETSLLKRNQTVLNRGLHRLKSMLDENGQKLEKLNQTLNQRLYPLLSKDAVVKNLQEQVRHLEKENQNQKALITELGTTLDHLNKEAEKEKEPKKSDSQESGQISAKLL